MPSQPRPDAMRFGSRETRVVSDAEPDKSDRLPRRHNTSVFLAPGSLFYRRPRHRESATNESRRARRKGHDAADRPIETLDFVSIFPLSFHFAPLFPFLPRLAPSLFRAIFSRRAYRDRKKVVRSCDISRILRNSLRNPPFRAFIFPLLLFFPSLYPRPGCTLIFFLSRGKDDFRSKIRASLIDDSFIICNKRLLSPWMSVDDFATGFIVIANNLFGSRRFWRLFLSFSLLFLSLLNSRVLLARSGFTELTLPPRPKEGVTLWLSPNWDLLTFVESFSFCQFRRLKRKVTKSLTLLNKNAYTQYHPKLY